MSLQVLPAPAWVTRNGSRKHVPGASKLVWEGVSDARVTRYFEAQFGRSTVGDVAVRVGTIDSGWPSLDMDESYRLALTDGAIRLEAPTTWGALRGLASLYQLQESDQLETAVEMRDQPRFQWRGLLLDVARHFIPLPDLYRVVDGLAVLKMNVLHLHLSDDQAFRFECRAWPRLASDERYSQAELADLVGYAADRGVRLVPELDVPGHVTSWLYAYPEWGSGNCPPTTRFGVHRGALHPASDTVDEALAVIFGELAEVFPDRHVHIGGDEVHPQAWDELGLDGSVPELQNAFNQRLVESINAEGRAAVAWDEVLHDEMPDCVVQNWRGATTRDRALRKGCDCVVSAGYYLDLFYPADVHYRYDPEAAEENLIQFEDSLLLDVRFAHVAEGMRWTEHWREQRAPPGDTTANVLGGEACLWSEIVDGPTLPARLWSRLPAVAERLWSPETTTDIESHYRRLRQLLEIPEFRWHAIQHRGFEAAGLRPEQIAFTHWLEPVKWYARLLGEEALQARLRGREMPQARPYDTNTKLDRVVDFLVPESLAARALRNATDEELAQLAAQWRMLIPDEWPSDVGPAVTALASIGELVKQWLEGSSPAREDLLELYGPYGEYMVAVVPALLARLDDD